MRVVVNQLSALGRKTGIGHYTGQLLRSLQAMAPGEIDAFPSGLVRRGCRVLTRARNWRAGATVFGDRTSKNSVRSTFRTQALEYLRQGEEALLGRYFRVVCSRARYDLYHEPNGIGFILDRPTVTTIHDLSVLLHPAWHPRDRVIYYERHFQRHLGQCAHVLVVSDFVRRQVIDHLNIPAERVTRAYQGIRADLRPMTPSEMEPVLKQLELPGRYLLYVGTLEPRKNILRLLQAYCSLPNSLRSEWPLLLVGDWGWNTSEVAGYLHDTARHRGVIHRGYVKDRHLAAIYNGARALLYPSWYEGFGLPPLEMMACGGAVLASTADAIVETTGRRAHRIPPDDVDGWRTSMQRVLEDNDWWQSLRVGVQAVVRPYTWEACARETLRVYRSVARHSDQIIVNQSAPSLRRAAG
jgi:alpha-1,3-rhamnosyl/mannosyltransferase